jgi:hypothetical protein
VPTRVSDTTAPDPALKAELNIIGADAVLAQIYLLLPLCSLTVLADCRRSHASDDDRQRSQ